MVMATGGMGLTRNIQPYDPTQQQTLGSMARGQYGRGPMPQAPQMPQTAIPQMTGDYTNDLRAYRSANPTTDNMDWIKQLAPEQQAWMQQNPGQGDNPTGPGLQPFGAPPPGQPGTNQPPPGGSTGPYNLQNPNTPAYSLDVGKYLNPQADYMREQAMKSLQGTYGGNFLSGPTMKAISDYTSNMAQGNAWNPAVATAAQQQSFGRDTNQMDRNFQYQAGLNDQQIPFNQQMQLAQLGLSGTQGQQSVSNLMATLLGQLSLGGGQAAGTGTIGAGNAISGGISQLISQLLQQGTMNNMGINKP